MLTIGPFKKTKGGGWSCDNEWICDAFVEWCEVRTEFELILGEGYPYNFLDTKHGPVFHSQGPNAAFTTFRVTDRQYALLKDYDKFLLRKL